MLLAGRHGAGGLGRRRLKQCGAGRERPQPLGDSGPSLASRVFPTDKHVRLLGWAELSARSLCLLRDEAGPPLAQAAGTGMQPAGSARWGGLGEAAGGAPCPLIRRPTLEIQEA